MFAAHWPRAAHPRAPQPHSEYRGWLGSGVPFFFFVFFFFFFFSFSACGLVLRGVFRCSHPVQPGFRPAARLQRPYSFFPSWTCLISTDRPPFSFKSAYDRRITCLPTFSRAGGGFGFFPGDPPSHSARLRSLVKLADTAAFRCLLLWSNSFIRRFFFRHASTSDIVRLGFRAPIWTRALNPSASFFPLIAGPQYTPLYLFFLPFFRFPRLLSLFFQISPAPRARCCVRDFAIYFSTRRSTHFDAQRPLQFRASSAFGESLPRFFRQRCSTEVQHACSESAYVTC